VTAPANWTWADGPIDGGNAAVIDVDGVISDAWHRQHFLDRTPRDWRSFFAACVDDEPIDSLLTLVRMLDPGLTRVLLTARPHWVLTDTLDWLRRHGVDWHLLILRGRGDGGLTSSQYKRRSLLELADHGFDLVVGLDDDIRNIEVLRDVGVPAVYIHSGYYD